MSIGGEWDFFLPVKARDIITSVTKFVDFQERQGKSGKMTFFGFRDHPPKSEGRSGS